MVCEGWVAFRVSADCLESVSRQAMRRNPSTLVIGNLAGKSHKIGSMGKPVPTYNVDLVDPDGNTVDEGDVVLVPTRDVASDKDVVREAEVARGNYRVDPETLDRPLKKIIGVVKRKAEQIFTAMITPTEENEDQN